MGCKSDGEATPHRDHDTDPETEIRAAATDGEIHDAMPLVTANRDAPEGIAPAHRNGSGRHPDPDTPPPDRLTAHGLEAIDQGVRRAEVGPAPPGRVLGREESLVAFNPGVVEVGED